MAHIESVTVTANATFGRDGAMFEGLLEFVAQLSLVLWSAVVVTAVLRFLGIRIFRRLAARSERAGLAASSAVVPDGSGQGVDAAERADDHVLQAPPVSADPSSSTLQRRAARRQHAMPLSSLQMSALASHSEE